MIMQRLKIQQIMTQRLKIQQRLPEISVIQILNELLACRLPQRSEPTIKRRNHGKLQQGHPDGESDTGPEVKFLPSGTAIANFGLAMSERYTDRQTGEQKENVCLLI